MFRDTKRDFDGVKWDFTFKFAVKPRANWIDVTYSAKADKQSKLMLMWGPRCSTPATARSAKPKRRRCSPGWNIGTGREIERESGAGA